MRQVASDWGLPYSTINNYFTKGSEPSLRVVTIVSQTENVNMEWLITGLHADQKPAAFTEKETISEHNESDELKELTKILARLSNSEIDKLLNQIYRNGVNSLFIKEENRKVSKITELLLSLPEAAQREILSQYEDKECTYGVNDSVTKKTG